MEELYIVQFKQPVGGTKEKPRDKKQRNQTNKINKVADFISYLYLL